jgi:hypothetical protein
MCGRSVDLGNFLLWFDQRINVNEGVMALVALLVGIGMQNFQGARRVAGMGFLVISALLAGVSIYEGGHRTVRVAPFGVELPPLFRNSHGDHQTVIVYDDLAENSVQLHEGDDKNSPITFLAANCLAGAPGKNEAKEQRDMESNLLDKMALRDEVNRKMLTMSGYRGPSRSHPDACMFSWDDNQLSINHYEIYVAIPGADGKGTEYAHLHMRAKKPTNVMIASDYTRIFNSLYASAEAAKN